MRCWSGWTRAIRLPKSSRQGQKARRSGLQLSVTAISGLGSRELWREHAVETAQAFNAMNPEYIGLLTLMVEPGTPLEKMGARGELLCAKARRGDAGNGGSFLQHIDSPGSVFRMNHASNYLTLKGTLNQDRERLLQQVRQGLAGRGLKDEFLRGLYKIKALQQQLIGTADYTAVPLRFFETCQTVSSA